MAIAPPPLLTSILIFSILSTPSSSYFSPTAFYFLNCGSSITTSTPSDNPTRFFVPDSTLLASTSTSIPLSNSSSSPSSLYSTARLFTSPYSSYKFATKSQGTYVVRLHFFPFASQTYNLSDARFTVSVLDRFALLTNFSVPPGSAPVVKEFLVPVDVDEAVLAFYGNPIAFVNAVEVFSAPQDLIDGVKPTSVNGNSVGPLPGQGLETVYRVNVGGALVTPANDTLWRTWVPDDRYVFDSSVSFTNSTSGMIRYYILSRTAVVNVSCISRLFVIPEERRTSEAMCFKRPRT